MLFFLVNLTPINMLLWKGLISIGKAIFLKIKDFLKTQDHLL